MDPAPPAAAAPAPGRPVTAWILGAFVLLAVIELAMGR